MPGLAEIQAAFLHDIYTGERTSLVYLDATRASPSRLDIYRNNAVLGLTDMLARAFPVLVQIVGEEFFKTVARHYIRRHPQPSGNRHAFGGGLADFLGGFKEARSLPYLRDIAAIEWAYFQAALADDAEMLDFESLGEAIATDPAFALTVHPGVSIVPQTFNALDIWQEHQKEEVGLVQLKSDPHQLVIWRGREDCVLIRRASDALAALVSHSRTGLSFAQSMAIAGENLTDLQGFQQEFADAMSLGLFARTTRDVFHD